MPNTFSIRIAGPAGTGVMSVGESLMRAMVKSGYYALGYPEYPSLIKGGHNTYQINISEGEHILTASKANIVMVLSNTAMVKELEVGDEKTILIADSSIEKSQMDDAVTYAPLLDIAREVGNPMTLNTAMLGFLAYQLRLDVEVVWLELKSQLSNKSDELLKQNKNALDNAYSLSRKYHLGFELPARHNVAHKLVMNGSQAIALGAIAAGMNLYAGYPMTPSSPVLHFLAEHQGEYGYIVRQTEDEIGAINMAVGASYAGAMSMVGTAGGGYALMQEGVSLAGALETPLVVYVAMRPGPATGLPTWTSQADLEFVIHSGHGEFPKIVIAPGDVRECYSLAYQAFAWSQKYQIPVLLLSDKYLAETMFCGLSLPSMSPVALGFADRVTEVKEEKMYSRYKYSANGVSDRTIPGVVDGEYLANSDEHREDGLVDESAENRKMQNQRRMNKYNQIRAEVPAPEIVGTSSVLVITWGSNKILGRILAMRLGYTHAHFSYVWPLPKDIEKILLPYSKLITVENNLQHQFARILKSETGRKIDWSYGEDDGRPLDVEIIIKSMEGKI